MLSVYARMVEGGYYFAKCYAALHGITQARIYAAWIKNKHTREGFEFYLQTEGKNYEHQ